MKVSLFYIFLFVIIVSCNTEKAESPVVDNTPVSVEDSLKATVKKFPDSLLAHENLIQYYRENGNYDLALTTVNKALQQDSSIARYWEIKAMLHVENEDTATAIKAFEKAIDLLPETFDIISLATLYAETKNSKALSMADALLVADKANAEKEALFIKGLYYSNINEKEKAIGFFDQCLSLNYSFMYAYREKCIALYDLGRYKEALDVINKSITLQNSYEEGYYYEGRCLEKLNRLPEAIESYQTALMYAPDYIEAKEALGKLGVKS